MRRVYMYVGEHQRLMGEVKKLPKPIAVVTRRGPDGSHGDGDGMEVDGEEREEGLEVVEVVRYKLVFAQRPEPVTGK
jgi:chromosome transmission fidelity protein 8